MTGPPKESMPAGSPKGGNPLDQLEIEPEERLRRFVVKKLRRLGAGDATNDLANEIMARYLRVRPVVYKPWLERVLFRGPEENPAWGRGSGYLR